MKEFELLKKHPAFNFGDKKVFIDYIDRNKEEMIFIRPILYTVQENRQLEKVLLTEPAEKIYEFIGDFLSTREEQFKDIHYREDCYEYLVRLGLKPKIAIEIAEEVRKGRWKMKGEKYKKYVPQEFSGWADGVKYLVSRDVIFGEFILIDNLPGCKCE